jgi:hypothetical protein
MSNYPPPQYPPPYQPMAQPNSTTAIISLIAGILGLTAFPIVGSIVAVVTGHMAKGEIARSNGTIGGGGLATAGLILGYIGLGLFVLGLCGFGLFLGLPICLAVLGSFATPHTNSMLLPLLFAA